MAEVSAQSETGYRVLARRWRPRTFADLVGQDALVQTLTNAIKSNKLAHAFLFSGIRGVGKTTTARILARSLNCIGPDGTGDATPEPCGVCPSCLSMDDDKAIDVIEMDAATRTGIGDIREIVDSVRYAPSASRFKIFIIDEVHMLSLQAFNGLLKTLEEPPPYVKFIFATTEVRKLPVTILSRCQRFDLKRVDAKLLGSHYRHIAQSDGIDIAAEAVDMIAHAAQGSVRDGLSLLDQARVLSDGAIDPKIVRDMLGLADHGLSLDFLTDIAEGAVKPLLLRFRDLSIRGIDPAAFVQDLMAVSHGLSCMAIDPQSIPDEFIWIKGDARAQRLIERLSIGHLARIWQMLLKGLDDVRLADDGDKAAEMILIRIAYAADMPPPGDLLKILQGEQAASKGAGPAGSKPAPSPTSSPAMVQEPETVPERTVSPAGFKELVQLLYRRGHQMLAAHLERHVGLIAYEDGRIELSQHDGPPDLAGRLNEVLRTLTGRRWIVAISRGPGDPTLDEQEKAYQEERLTTLAQMPEIQNLLQKYPGSRLVAVQRTQSPDDDHHQRTDDDQSPDPGHGMTNRGISQSTGA